MTQDFTAVVSWGTLASDSPTAFTWADSDVVVESKFTGMHVSHVAVAGCVLNDTRREAQKRGIPIDGVRVSVRGGFDLDNATYGPIDYVFDVDSPAPTSDVRDLTDYVEQIAEIPRALADSVAVRRVDA